MDLKKFLHKNKVTFMIYICDMIFMQIIEFERSNCRGNMAKSVVFLISTYNYGKTKTKFESLKTPSWSAYHSGPRFVNIWNGYWKKCFFFVGQCNGFLASATATHRRNYHTDVHKCPMTRLIISLIIIFHGFWHILLFKL